MSKKDFSVALKYVEARPRSQRRKGAEARVSGIPVGGSGVSATDLSLLQANLISVTNNFTALKDLFDSMFEKDSDGNIHAKLSLWSSGGITAGGVGSGGSGGGGISYNRLDSWSDYSADKSGWVLSALLGNDLNTRLISVENAGYITTSALAPYALRSEIPSLEGYATLDALNTLSQTVVNFKSLFDSMFEKDSEGNIHAKLSLWSSGGITAGGVGSGGSGGGISYNRLDAWSDYSADKAGYVLSALLGKDLDNRVSALANAGYVTQSALAPYVLRSEVEGQYLSKNGGTVNGSITLSIGNLVVSSGDTVVGKIYPRTDNEYTLGQDTRKWKNILCYNINGSTPVNASNLKSTLGISDWALASAKPTYTASEVGALSVNGGDIGGSLNFRNGSSITCANGIVLEMYAGVDTYLRGSSNIYISAPNVYTQRNVYTYKVLDSGNYSSYALPITGGTVNGSITATSFIGNLTGTADNASLLSNRRLNLYGNPFSAIPYVGADGVMEVGQYIDFHAIGDVAESDYSLRLECTGAYGNWITLPTKSGVLALTSDVLSVNGGTVNGLVQAPFFSASEWMSARFFTSDISPVSVNTTGMCRWGTFDEVGGLKIQFGADSDTKIEVINRERNAALFRIDTSGKVWAADTITSPSFIGNLTGTADRASTQAVLYSNRDVNLWDIVNRTARYFALGDTAQNTPSGVYALGSILMEYSWDTNAGFQMISKNAGNTLLYRSRWNGTFKDWREIAFTDSNVASATKLATPRTIWGQSFDGTQDITGALTAPVINTNTLKVGNVTLVEENGALKVIGGFIATGGVTSGEKTS